MKWLRCLLALALMVVGVQLVAASSSYAASDYDGLIHTSPSLYVYTDGSAETQKMDISQSWLDELGQAYAMRVQYSGFPSNLMSVLNASKASGSLGLVMVNDPSAGNTVEVFGSTDPNAYCGFNGDAVGGSFGCIAHAGYDVFTVTYFTYNTYGGNANGCGYWWAPQMCSDNGMGIYTAPMVATGTTQLTSLFSAPNPQLHNYSFYYLKNFTVTYPDGYAGAVIPNQPPNATYVAMGDSFSSGEGNPPFEGGTNVYTDTCHRSSAAYPRLLENDPTLSMGSTAFVACSGATTSTVLNGGSGQGTWGEGPQTQALSAATQVVTITIGGNDIGFSDFAKACAQSSCDSSTSIYATTMGSITNDLPAALKNTYEQILMKAPNAKVYVIDYPQVAPAAPLDPKDMACYYLYNGSTYWGNGQAAHDVVSALDAAISNEVTTVQQESADYAYRLHYVSTGDASSPFVGHTLCYTGNSYFQNIDQAGNNAAYVFHPNANGHVAYEGLVRYAITGGIA